MDEEGGWECECRCEELCAEQPTSQTGGERWGVRSEPVQSHTSTQSEEPSRPRPRRAAPCSLILAERDPSGSRRAESQWLSMAAVAAAPVCVLSVAVGVPSGASAAVVAAPRSPPLLPPLR